MINYHRKKFRSIQNSDNGTVDKKTLFEYRQNGAYLWGHYAGGAIRIGTLTGTVDIDGTLVFTYCHMERSGTIRHGHCISTPEVLPGGFIRLHEKWQWLDGDKSEGSSTIQEF